MFHKFFNPFNQGRSRILPAPFLIVVLIFFHLASASAQSDCPFENIEWMEQSQNYNSKDQVSLIKAALTKISFDTVRLKKDGEATNYIDWIKDLNSQHKKYKVSQEFFEMYKQQRSVSCVLYAMMHERGLNVDQKSKAFRLLLDILASYSKIDSLERRYPSIVIEGFDEQSGYFTITNCLNNRYTLTIVDIRLYVVDKMRDVSFWRVNEYELHRIELKSIIFSTNKRDYSLLDKTKYIDIPPNKSKPFYFRFSAEDENSLARILKSGDYDVLINVKFIDPITSKVADLWERYLNQ